MATPRRPACLNLISKRPQAEAFNEIGVQYGSFNRKQVQMDSTGKLTKDGEWLYRFIGVFRDSGTQTDYVPDDRIVLAPSLTWRPTNNTNWTVLGTYQKDKTGSSTAFLPHEGTLYPGPNGLIPVRRFAGEPGFDKYQTETGAVSSLFEHSFSDGAEDPPEHALRPCRGHLPNDVSEFELRRSVNPINPNFPFLDPGRRTVARDIWSRETVKDSFTSDSNAELKLLTGPVAHKAAVRRRLPRAQGTRAIRLRHRSPRHSISTRRFTAALTPPALSPEPDLRQSQLGLYVQDQMRLGPWLAIVGLRQDYVTSNVVGSPEENTKATTGRAGLMYELPFGLTPYVSYAQSFTPIFGAGVCIDGICKAAAAAKWWSSASSTIRLPARRSTARSSTPPKRTGWRAIPAAPLFSIQTGKVRIRGAELEVITRVTPDLDLIGAYSYLNAMVESGDNAGKRVETVPEHQASLWAKYRLTALGLQGVTVGGGVRYIGESWDGTDTIRTPDYTLFDAMIRYETGPWRFQVNASNLADKRHVTTCLARGDCFFGIGRTVLGSATYRF